MRRGRGGEERKRHLSFLYRGFGAPSKSTAGSSHRSFIRFLLFTFHLNIHSQITSQVGATDADAAKHFHTEMERALNNVRVYFNNFIHILRN